MIGAPPRSDREPGAAAFVWSVWVVMLAVVLGFVARFGSAIPIGDDYDVMTRALGGAPVDPRWLATAAALTDANGALFDPHHDFRGCLPGIHEVLRRQGLVRGTWTLDPAHTRIGFVQAQRPARSITVMRSQPDAAKRSSGTVARVRLSPWTATAAEPAPCTMTRAALLHSTSTPAGVRAAWWICGPCEE